MLIPVGHDHGELRRWPVLSFIIIGLCTVLQVLPSSLSHDKMQEADEAFSQSLEYYVKHPELKPHPLLRNVALRYAARLPSDERDDLRAKIASPPPPTSMTDLRQDELDKET
ncbi:MAG TPA: hypothetical protein VMT89_07485, partial [Candidatus Acidoferrales bacterium]|nr:hypothetical protein [Candidatus Acidoferrales bacterium]